MADIHLSELDDLTGAPGTYHPVVHDCFEISPTQWAEMSRDAWFMQPLQEKNGFDRVKAHIWATGDWFLSDNQVPAMLSQAETHHLQDVGPQISFERTLSGHWHFLFDDGESVKGGPGVI